MVRLVFLLFAVFALNVSARSFPAQVTHVTDGDTLWVRSGRTAPRALRLRGIDAPELCQPHGREARAALAARVLHRGVTVTLSGRDDYRRWLATVRSGEGDVGAWLVAEGHAWSHRWQRRAGPYTALETRARETGRGLWASRTPLSPREFRKTHGQCR